MTNEYTHKDIATATLSTSPEVLYTPAPYADKAIIHVITLTNTGASTRRVTVLVRGKACFDDDVLSHETKAISGPHVLVGAQELVASQDAGADVDLLASGVEVTEV